MSEIQYQNRILLRKMLQIDLKPSTGVVAKPRDSLPESNPNALNAYNSLNRANRIRELAKIVDDNQTILQRLQSASSVYNANKWSKDHEEKEKIVQRISGQRYCRNPYFLHSVCTKETLPVTIRSGSA